MLPSLLRVLAICLLLPGLGACVMAPLPPDSPAARYDDSGTAGTARTSDFGLF